MARAAEPRGDRRAEIARALYLCMSKRGYANTTLKDIAGAAGMTPSHVGYYFDDQAAILEHYALGLCERIVDGFPDLSEPDAARLIDAVVEFCFGERQLNSEFLGVIQELSGLAVHDARLNRIKTEHAAAWRRYLEALFQRVGARRLDARDAASIAHALVVGLDTNSLFDRTLTRDAARALFRGALRTLAGLTDGAQRAQSPRRARGARTRQKRGAR
ncbi:MAG TPA: TetR/AcrR family transcriptional regulator [Myxococcota bacterium]|nr:TetR/AcrR family transcriptional regulator [Myxococcota bacterium]